MSKFLSGTAVATTGREERLPPGSGLILRGPDTKSFWSTTQLNTALWQPRTELPAVGYTWLNSWSAFLNLPCL